MTNSERSRSDSEHDPDPREESEAQAEFEAEMRAEYSADMMADVPSSAELLRYQREYEEWLIIQEQKSRAEVELPQYFVLWDQITQADVDKLMEALDNAKVEEDIQSFLTSNPQFLIQHLSGGHGRFVLPKPRLGGQLVPDYLLVNEDSGGLHWHGLELESPKGVLFTGKEEPTAGLQHAIIQVRDWRSWLRDNIDFARRPVANNGCGFVGIDGDLAATILMGRRHTPSEKFNEFRNQTEKESRITIHSFDWLVDVSQQRVNDLARARKKG